MTSDASASSCHALCALEMCNHDEVDGAQLRCFQRALIASVTMAVASSCSSGDEEPATPHVANPEVGARLYANTCALCHGAKGEGYIADNATALRSPTFLRSASDQFLTRSIARGRPKTPMSAWGKAKGGPYRDDEISDIVAFLRTWQTEPSVRVVEALASGDREVAEKLYADKCASCHGATGVEGPYVRTANPEYLSVASDGFLRYALFAGRPGTLMKPYEGDLSIEDMNALVGLMRSRTAPVDDAPAEIPTTMGQFVLNPGGPEPGFTLGQRFTSTDIVHAELVRGSSFGFVDARPPSDYVVAHIAHAANVPFYQAEDYLFALPKDKWLVVYCGCPHAESGVLLDKLLANGFTKVTILDEGFNAWNDRGYPVNVGGAP